MSSTPGLVELSRDLGQARTLEQIQRIVRRAARRLTQADGATFVIREEEHCLYVDEDAIAPLWKGRRFAMTDCISGWCMLNRSTAVIDDVFSDPRIPHDVYRRTFVKSMAMIPIGQANPVGAIGVYWARRRRPTRVEMESLNALADGALVALERLAEEGPRVPLESRTALAAERCRNLYAFLRLRLGTEPSDRELARRWNMNWRSFLNLKEGARRVPRLEELESLADWLGVDPALVVLVARGEPADTVNRWLLEGEAAIRHGVLERLGLSTGNAGAPLLQASIDQVPCGVLTIDLRGRVRDYNARVAMLVSDPDRIGVDADFINAVHPESAAAFLKLQSLALESGEGGTELLRLDSGDPVYISMAGVPDAEGRTIGFQCVLQPLPVNADASGTAGSRSSGADPR